MSGGRVATARRIEESARHVLDSFGFWLIVAYAGLGMVMFVLYFVGMRTHELQTQHLAQEEATKAAQVETCFSDADNGPGLRVILLGLENIALNQVQSLTASIDAQPHNPLVPTWQLAILRAERALAATRDFRATAAATTPTRAECRSLAMLLGVPQP